MITIRGLQKHFGRTDALRGVDLEIPQGKVTAFLGPNGAGKTTTIKCAMNLIERDAGEISVLDTDPRELGPEHWRRIGYVSENRILPGWMTVPKLLDYVRPMYGDRWPGLREEDAGRLRAAFEDEAALPLARPADEGRAALLACLSPATGGPG
ncbi:ATP-binding cassette domain-containing protein [Luteolibacter luteus]|uniref:ATP-binding cassette domain-containing protein n=1 Tax=Luteolibacter luteus TaxID=2728835 RepID=UPI00197C1A52|nr:ATP-binding cassette domain-containing protein [Luteolibacter luteus]